MGLWCAGPFWRGAMGSSCSSAQKKDKKQRCSPEGRRRSSVRSTDSLPYGKEATPPPAPPEPPAPPTHHNGAAVSQGSPGLESLASPLLGRLGEGEEEEQGSRQLGLYVCSALPDTLAERTLLMERVYPALRHQAAQRGYDLCLADLHWGMRLNDRALLAEVCLSTLARLRARGRLLALVLLPERLEGGLPQTLPPWLPGGLAGGLAEWYVPDGRGGQRLRAPVGDAAPLEAALREVLSPLQRALYLTSVLEEEVRAAVLCPAQRPQDCVWLERRWTHRPRPDGAPPADDDGARRFGALRGELEDRLPEAHKLVVRARWGEAEEASYLAEVGSLLERALGALLDGAAEADAAQEAGRPCGNLERALALELCQQGAWARDLARGFVGRTESLSRLERYVQSGGGRPLVVHGPPGVGKSALVARAAALCADWLPGAPVVARFVGAVPASPDRLLCSLCEHVCALSGVHPAEASRSGADRRALLGSLLGRSERPLVLVLDGLDQLEGDWDWLPARLPPHVRLLLTLRDGCPQLVREELEPECLLALGPLPVPEAEAIVRAALERSGRILNPEQWTLVAACLEREGSPLQAHLLAALAERWGPDDQPPGDTTLGGLAAEAVRLAEREVGPRLVPFVLGLLSVARHGLSDAEVLDALSRHPATFEACPSLDGSPARCPPGLWALVRTVLRPFLRTRVVAGRALHTWRGEAHRALLCEGRLDADTMRDCALALVALFSEGRDARSLVELPWIALGLARRGDGAALGAALGAPGQPPLALVRERFLLDAGWLRDKATAAEPWLLLEELRTYLSLEPSDAECCLLAETLELAAYALRYDGRQLAAQLWARLRRRLEQGDLPRLEALCAALRAAGPGLEPRSAHLREPGAQTWTGPCAPSDEGPCLGRLYTIRGDAAHMVSLDRADLRVWDVRAERVVRHLAGLPQPRDLQMVDPFRALVLCDRELRVYSLDEGRLLVRLKGVMNQKMAYFGLHGRDYAVALSRNRMYVNMLSLDSGDLETTFKVGEDRFLNSLLVSANGKICVCGDETQKPFPLLVWDLSRRKLLYDLRIPHHEFLTRLSAISGDGHYVVCVCRELSDSAPNFIIVYDLQSGTLFKKWKPERNSCSIAISSQGGCVLNGLDNCFVLVWDLATGARRFTLPGHSAPVDEIRLDESGLRALTRNAEGVDRSVRVWDLMKGECLAVFTPDLAVTCCELSLDGRAVAMGLERHSRLFCHLLTDAGDEPSEAVYGNAALCGQRFDLAPEA
ncbi:unnamed protein product [Ixodes persulcatus]